jgi:tRNA pseudouridine32 synthase/23S rRNA pseudouridine746 synthase
MQAIGHPILGCEFYGGEFAAAADRLLLHATDLRFVHPLSGEDVFTMSAADF